MMAKAIMTMLAIFVSCVAAGLLGAWLLHVDPPTAEQLYGCTPAQQAPNGECQ